MRYGNRPRVHWVQIEEHSECRSYIRPRDELWFCILPRESFPKVINMWIDLRSSNFVIYNWPFANSAVIGRHRPTNLAIESSIRGVVKFRVKMPIWILFLYHGLTTDSSYHWKNVWKYQGLRLHVANASTSWEFQSDKLRIGIMHYFQTVRCVTEK